MSPRESFMDLLPGSMNQTNGRKRPSTGHDSASKRHQPTMSDHESMFVTDDDELDSLANDDFAIATSDRLPRLYGSTGQVRETSAQFTAPPISNARRQSQAQTNGTTSRTTNGGSSSQSRSTNKANSTPPKKKSSDTEIKEEQDTPLEADWIKDMPDADRIRVYIGKRQRITYAGRADLIKSPILTSYIIEDAETGAYIMRPQLLKTDPTDFDAVLQFIHTGEFNPVLIDKDGEKAFEKIRSDEAYGKELVRLGKVYVLAQTFQVQGLEDAIYNKICAVNARRFPNKAFVDLAGVIFSDKRAGAGARSASGSQDGNGSQDGQGQKDKLEEWVISKIAGQFQEIQKYQHEDFWAVEKKTTKKMFFARLLEETADVYRANSGRPPNPAVVELLD